MKTHALLATLALLPTLAHAAGDAGACRYVPVAKMAIDYSDQARQPTITGTINGKPARMLVDTGAANTNLMRAGADRLGLTLTASGRYSNGVGGASVTYVTRVDDFSVGDSHTGRIQMPVIGNTAMHGPNDAIVGADYLLQTDLEVSLADKFVQFFRASDCADTNLAYWDSNAMEVPFIGHDGRSNKPFVEVELNGVKFKALLDTGAMVSVITRHAAAQAGVNVDGPGVRKANKVGGIGDAALDTWTADFKTFRIGDETVNNPQMKIADDFPQGQGDMDVLLGTDFLRAHHVLFAMSQNRVYLSYLGGPLFGAPGQPPKP